MNDDTAQLKRMGYEQELHRGMGGFSNFAVSFSIICILAGGITSFHMGFGVIGGAAAGIVWPVACVLSLIVAGAFARDGGLPFSAGLRKVSKVFKTPAVEIWVASGLTILFCVYTPVYGTITAAAVIFLYISYTVPTVLGFFASGNTWREPGPWSLGGLYRPLAVVAAVGCLGLVVIAMMPPYETNVKTLGGAVVLLLVVWWGCERRRFTGPPRMEGLER
jgi:hypothetical protein